MSSCDAYDSAMQLQEGDQDMHESDEEYRPDGQESGWILKSSR